MKILHLLIVVVFGLDFAENSPVPCVTPNSEKAHCVSLFSCPVLQQALANPDETVKKFVEASKCGGDFNVCCGAFGNYTMLPQKAPEKKAPVNEFHAAAKHKDTRREMVVKYFSPLSQYCGLQHSDDHFNEGNGTAIDEFPWLVHIEYLSPYSRPTKGTEFKCAGVLISNQFVLTSHACAGYQITSVKIGQYHKGNVTSCVSTSLFGTECNDPVLITFGPRQDVPNSDLILIMLTKKLQFSDYVRPICLPFQESHRPKVGDTVYTSGWGEEDITGSTVHIKKKLSHTVESYDKIEGRDTVSFGSNGSSLHVCEGDQGGPLMYCRNHQWFVTALVTKTPCNLTRAAVANAITAETMESLMDPLFYFLILQH